MNYLVELGTDLKKNKKKKKKKKKKNEKKTLLISGLIENEN